MNKLVVIFLILSCCSNSAGAQADTTLKISLPTAGKIRHDKPVGKGWINLLDSQQWNKEEKYWHLANGLLHGESENESEHH